MQIRSTGLEGLVAIEPDRHADERGFFVETYRRGWYEQAGIPAGEEFVQDNHSRSSRGVLRGLHLQVGAGVAKLVRCVRGRIFDVGVDLRRGSPTYGRWAGVELDDESLCELYLPVGFAHGFCVLSESADFFYKCTELYAPELDRTIAWNDPAIGVRWPLAEPLLSSKDREAPLLSRAPVLPSYSW